MAASAIFILDLTGKVLISRNYRGDIPLTCVENFATLIAEEDDFRFKPIFQVEGVSYCCVKYGGVFLVGFTNRNTNACLLMAFLHRLVSVFKDYFNEMNQESIRDNFVIIYELLDEMMDYGYPQTTESKILKEYILQESHKQALASDIPIAVTNAVSWRKEGIKYRKNEIFVDTVEKVNLLVGSKGQVLHSEVIGALKMRSYLSGMPELKLGLNDKILMEAMGRNMRGKSTIEMDDIKFHQCVRLARFENDRTISFIPPDGEFDLLTYRLTSQVKPLIWVEVENEAPSNTRVAYVVKAKAQFKQASTATGVEIRIPVPSDADSPQYNAGQGAVRYIPEDDVIVWTIKSLQGGKELMMRANFGLPSIRDEESKAARRAVTVNFEIPYFTVSGIQVRYLKIIEKSGYQALPWVRYITQGGDYQIRFDDTAKGPSADDRDRY
jgi:AP-1 complex subunit mu